MYILSAFGRASLLAFALSASGVAAFAQNTIPKNIAEGAKVTASSTYSSFWASKVADGQISSGSRWLSADKAGPHTLTLQLAQSLTIGAVQVISGFEEGGAWQDAIKNFTVQYRSGEDWKDVPEGLIKANTSPFLNIKLERPIETDALRLVIQDSHIVRVVEVRAYAPAPSYPTLELPVTGAVKTPLFVNQSGYDLDGPKRFTAPTMADGTAFSIKSVSNDATVFSGTLKAGLGDFTAFRPQQTEQDYIVEAAGLKSDPFQVAPLFMERISLAPALHFMVDARSVVGTHNSAYGGMPWRDGTYYTYELPSIVMLYLSAPDYFENAPIEINYASDKARVLAPNFKLYKSANDTGALQAARDYYTKLDAPIGTHVPDAIQLIHWGIGWHMMKPISSDPSGDPVGAKLHPQVVEEFAFFLNGLSYYGRYFSADFQKKAHDFAFDQWEKVGLFDVITQYGSFKGRNAPGHSVLPNLLMYQVAKRENRPDAERFLNAAVAQAKWIVDNLDPTKPENTKGQRMSEHKTITGLTTLLRDYLHQAPIGLKVWLSKWADTMIERSNNEWDFRRFDTENWSLPKRNEGETGNYGPGWNEPGNLAGFPACALPIADLLDDQTKATRLRQISVGQWDTLFGRNPLGAHSAYFGAKDWYGVERGWPKQHTVGICAWLELTRGSLSSSPATEHYPYNPKGALRHPEGWTAFNSAFNVALAYGIQENTKVSLWAADFKTPLGATAKAGTIGIELLAPLSAPSQVTETATVSAVLPDGSSKSLVLRRADPQGIRFRGALSLSQKGTVRINYGYGWLSTGQSLIVK